MTRIVVFTPTIRHGGLDVVADGLRRQKLPDDTTVIWLIADSLPHRTSEIKWGEILPGIPIVHITFPFPEPGTSNLCKACNWAMDYAIRIEGDLLVSVHDYTWIPEDGLAKFLRHTDKRSITAGVCHHAKEADPVVNPKGMFTVFAEPYRRDSMPPVSWVDCRYRENKQVRDANPIEWEPPWAAIGKDCLYDTRLYFDEEFDKAFRYENQDFAFRAQSLGYRVCVDSGNEAVQMAHWDYFKEDYAEHNARQEVNRQLIRERWGA